MGILYKVNKTDLYNLQKMGKSHKEAVDKQRKFWYAECVGAVFRRSVRGVASAAGYAPSGWAVGWLFFFVFLTLVFAKKS